MAIRCTLHEVGCEKVFDVWMLSVPRVGEILTVAEAKDVPYRIVEVWHVAVSEQPDTDDSLTFCPVLVFMEPMRREEVAGFERHILNGEPRRPPYPTPV